MIQWYAVTSATSGFTTVAAAYQTICKQYYRIATVCVFAPLVAQRIFPIHFLTTQTLLRCGTLLMLSDSLPVRIDISITNPSGSALPISTVASGHNSSDRRTKTTKSLSTTIDHQARHQNVTQYPYLKALFRRASTH